MHHIQKSIILNLARTSPLRFTDLQPPRTPNNTFSYHLKKLITAGYVLPVPEGYIATRKGLKLVVFGISTNKIPSTPKLISMLYIENTDGEVLLINRDRKPFQGWYGLPSGLVHLGETSEQAAHREMYEKTTIVTDDAFVSVGVLDVRYVDQETQDIFVHTVAFIYKYNFRGDKQLLENKVSRSGQLSWSKLGRSNILPEVKTVKKMVDRGEFTHESITFAEPPQLPTLAGEPENESAGAILRPVPTATAKEASGRHPVPKY